MTRVVTSDSLEMELSNIVQLYDLVEDDPVEAEYEDWTFEYTAGNLDIVSGDAASDLAVDDFLRV